MITDEMRDGKNLIKYKVDNFDIMFENGDIEKMDGDMVTHLYMEKDFDDLYFPIINISVLMQDNLYHRIKAENETVKFRLRLVKNLYDKDFNFLSYEMYFNEVFQCFKDKQNVIEEKEVNESKREMEDDAVTMGNNTRDFYLFTDEVTKCKKFFNMSIESALLSDLLIYILGEAGISQLLMTKLENNPTLNNITIPPGDTIDTINYLNNIKTFYRKGLQLFFDVDTSYLIDKNCKCTAWRKNEVKITHVHVSNQQSSDSQMNGQYIDEDRKQTHVFTSTGRVDVRNTNITKNQLEGHKIRIINPKANSTQNVTPQSTSVGSQNEQMFAIKDDAVFMSSNIQTVIEENECICTVVLVGVDSEVVSPNKEVLLTYEDDPELQSIYGGTYRIARVLNTLTKDAGELVGETQVILKKQE